MSVGYIDDGYTLPGFIDSPVLGRQGAISWEPLTFTYRVATRPEWLRLDAKVDTARSNIDRDPECAVKAEQLQCDFVADHILEWTLKDSTGRDVSKSGAAAMSMHALLFQKLYYIIRGDLMSDPRPPSTKTTPDDGSLQKN